MGGFQDSKIPSFQVIREMGGFQDSKMCEG